MAIRYGIVKKQSNYIELFDSENKIEKLKEIFLRENKMPIRSFLLVRYIEIIKNILPDDRIITII